MFKAGSVDNKATNIQDPGGTGWPTLLYRNYSMIDILNILLEKTQLKRGYNNELQCSKWIPKETGMDQTGPQMKNSGTILKILMHNTLHANSN